MSWRGNLGGEIVIDAYGKNAPFTGILFLKRKKISANKVNKFAEISKKDLAKSLLESAHKTAKNFNLNKFQFGSFSRIAVA